MKPTLYGTFGYLGAGKTYFSRRFSEKEKLVHLSGDMIRTSLFKKPQYTKEENEMVFGLMDVLAADILSKGLSVIYDVCLNKKEHRERLRQIARENGASFKTVWIHTDESIALARLNDPALTSTPERQYITFMSDPLKIFDRVKNEMERPEQDVIMIEGTKGFTQQYADFLEQNT
ncbi:ATP-binding protein [Candidatus Kaiserbacteria bacterium]|nr:ATP-binding protein [Candidatus Kaiserbacteria bacterium]MCB9811763.1 ATP-binding protein [Candidatus Nomurabacteria bacterium]